MLASEPNKFGLIGDAVTELVDDGTMTFCGKQQEHKLISIVDSTIGGKGRVAREQAQVDPRCQSALPCPSPSKDSYNQSTDGDEDAEASDDVSATQEDLADSVMGLLIARSWAPQRSKAKAKPSVKLNFVPSMSAPSKPAQRSSASQRQSAGATVGANSAPGRSVYAQAVNGPNT